MPWVMRMLIRFFLASVIFYIYIGWQLSKSITELFSFSLSTTRAIVFFGIFLINLLPLFIMASYWTGNGRNLFLYKNQLQGLDFVMLFPYWWGLIVLVEVLPYFFSIDILGYILRIIPSIDQNKLIKWQAVFKIALVSFFLLYVGIRSYFDTYHVKTTPFQIAVENLPDEFENLNMVLTGDIQIDRYTQDGKITHFKEQLKSANPDLLLFAGDLVTSGKHFIPQSLDVLCDTQASLERIACIGDHDYWADPQTISQGIQNCGWTFLDNQHHVIEHKGRKILITGVTYIYSVRTPTSQLKQLLAQAPEVDLKILLVHQPAQSVIETAEEFGYDLLVAGHTHGGQLIFRPFGIPLSIAQFMNKIYSGYGQYKSLQVLVTNGVGLTLSPLRYRASAEIMKITFVKKNAAD